MTDHKFPDEELEKTLHICSHYAGNCSDYCPLRHDDECVQTMARHSLALITRQNAELADLREIVFMDRSEAIKNLKAEAIKEFWSELKRRSTLDPRMISTISGDNLVKEMTEEQK